MIRMVEANNWKDGCIHIHIKMHLKGTVIDFYEKNKEMLTQ